MTTDKTPGAPRPTMKPTEAAAALGITRGAVYWHMKAGNIPFISLGRSKLILRETVDRLLSEGLPRAADAPAPVDPLS